MLVITRKKNESIVIGDDIVITITGVRGTRVFIGIEAPSEVPVHRMEVFEAIRSKKTRRTPQSDDPGAPTWFRGVPRSTERRPPVGLSSSIGNSGLQGMPNNADGMAGPWLPTISDIREVVQKYYDRDGDHVSTELFDSEGFITESIHGRNHWWYDRAVPQRFEGSSSLFVKDGDRWIRKR